jgi:uncharacterized phage protein (TIGR01671 family)
MFRVIQLLFIEGKKPIASGRGGSASIDEDTVLMQFTGLLDKNSKEIYEGDVLDIRDTTIGTEDVVRGEVYWCDSYLCWSIQWLPKQSGGDSLRLVKKSLKRTGETPSSELGDRRWPFVEVVGNIYENPELLNG